MSKRPTKRSVAKVHEFLEDQEFQGSTFELADAMGIGIYTLRGVLNHVRTRDFIEEHHWTVPYVTRGLASNTWSIRNTTDVPTDQPRMRESQLARAAEMLATTERNIAQCRLAQESCDGRTSDGKYWRRTMIMFQAAQEHLEHLLEVS